MKINTTKPNMHPSINIAKENVNKGVYDKINNFDSIIKQCSIDSINTEIEQIINDIEKQREKLIENTTLFEFNKYKKLVGKFVRLASENFELKKNDFYDYQGRHKVVKNIEIINSKLDEITSNILEENKDNFKIVSALDEIKGLIIDVIY